MQGGHAVVRLAVSGITRDAFSFRRLRLYTSRDIFWRLASTQIAGWRPCTPTSILCISPLSIFYEP